MRRICIVTTGALGSNPRVVKEAETLHHAGYQVVVIACRNVPWVDPRDEEILRQLDCEVVRLDFVSAPERFRARLMQKFWRAVYTVTRSPFALDRGLGLASASLIKAALKRRADLYIAHYPPALPAAAIAARKYGGRYSYDAEDFHPGETFPDARMSSEETLITKVEGRHSEAAAFLTAAAPGIADAYADTYEIDRPTPILNAFPKRLGPPRAERRGSVEPGPSVYWFSQTIGPNRGLETVIEAMRIAQTPFHLHLQGTLSPAFNAFLAQSGSAGDLAHRIHLHEPVPASDLHRAMSDFDVGIIGETNHTVSRDVALTNKLFAYLTAGLPALMSDITAHRNIQPELGEAGLLFKQGDPEDLAARIDELFADANRLKGAREAAWQLGQSQFSWETEEQILLKLVDECLSGVESGLNA